MAGDHAAVGKLREGNTLLQIRTAGLGLFHDHPSGDPTPSQADIQMTKNSVDIAKPPGISVHDHIVKVLTSFHRLELF